MRSRLLADAAALADYEILEMLLFLGIPRRDTKPQAKALINRFGSLAAALRSDAAVLQEAGLPSRVAEAFRLVRDAAGALAASAPVERARLSDWDALQRHLDLPARAAQRPGISALLLDARNQLIAEHKVPPDLADAAMRQDVLRQALVRHAAAVIVLRNAGRDSPVLVAADRRFHDGLAQAAAPLSLAVHDLVVLGAGRWVSLRRHGE